MNKLIKIFVFLLISNLSYSQYIEVDTETYSAEELINNVLISDPSCIQVDLIQAYGGNFENGKSYGYVNRANSPLFFEDGVILSTGNALNAIGPNDSLNHNDAPNWGGDTDFEEAFGMTNESKNATFLEFSFIATSSQIEFNYVFASDEYLEDNSSTCNSQDGVAFLIKHEDSISYKNFAISKEIPQFASALPISVENIHPSINSCSASNEVYFEGFNQEFHYINFNGQTLPFNSSTPTIPGEKYFAKIVVADDTDHKYDSAVFIEGGSFKNNIDIANRYQVCPNSIELLEIADPNNQIQNIKWFKENKITGDFNEIIPPDESTQLEITEPGIYKLIVTYLNGCVVEDIIEIQYISFEELAEPVLSICESNNDGLGTFNLTQAINIITDENPYWAVVGFYLTEAEALNNLNPIENINEFQNSFPDQEIFVRVKGGQNANNLAGCSGIRKVTLTTTNYEFDPITFTQCYDNGEFNINFPLFNLSDQVQEATGLEDFYVVYYANRDDLDGNKFPLSINYQVNKGALPKSIFGKVFTDEGCQGTIEVKLGAIEDPNINFEQDSPILCLGNGDFKTIGPGILDEIGSDISFKWSTGETSEYINVDEAGTYTVEIIKELIIDGQSYECSYFNEVTVIGSEQPQIDYRLFGDINNQKVEIITLGNGNYAYALNDQFGEYSESNIFNVDIGQNIAYVKDLNGCGTSFLKFKVIGFLEFFTPNNDGINDKWKLLEIERFENDIKHIVIFDRFGKQLKSLLPYQTWDGTYNGKNLPSNEYWFLIKFKDGTTFQNHFTLKR